MEVKQHVQDMKNDVQKLVELNGACVGSALNPPGILWDPLALLWDPLLFCFL